MKKITSLTVIALGLCFGSISINPSNAFEITENKSEKTLISQLRGHDTYAGEPQMEWGDSLLGTVVGKSGGIMSIVVEDGGSFNADGYVSPGSNVLVGKDENGEYYLVSAAEAEWISILEEDYGWKRNTDYTQTSLNERTAAIWASMETTSTTRDTITPRPQTQVIESDTDMNETIIEAESDPVRGLW